MNMYVFKVLLTLFSLQVSIQCWALYYLDHINAQYAGEIGLVSLGAGKHLTPRLALTALYGIVPPEISNTERLETLSLRLDYRLYDVDRFRLYGLFSIYHILGLRNQTSRYGDPPSGYYSMNSLRALIGGGASVAINKKRDVFFYHDIAVNNMWIENSLYNRDITILINHVSLSLGWRTHF